jgi:hypothetical protein
MIVAFLVSMTVVLAIAQGGKVGTKLTKENAGGILKGTWQGNMMFGSGLQCLFVMTVDNDAPPFKGKLSMQNIPAQLQTQLAGGMSGNTYEGAYENGLITNKGTLIISGQGGNFGEWTLKGDKLAGWFYLWGSQGTITLKKK